MIFDSHCHIQFKAFDEDRGEVIKKCKEKETVMNLVGTQKDTSKKAVKMAENNEDMYATVGLHPIQSKKVKVEEENTSFVARGEDFDTDFYQGLIDRSDKVVAVGETGLDKFHIPKDMSVDRIVDDQWSAFVEHAKLAENNDLPLVMHIRNAHDEMIERLKNSVPKVGGVVHCFTGNWEQAREYIEMGFHIGFTGIVTFPPKSKNPKPQEELLKVVERTPLESILVETDAPFLAPQEYRGDRAEPWMTEEVIKKIAEVKNMSYEKVRKKTVNNTKNFFNI